MMKVSSWIARIAVALILLQTVFSKFTGAPGAKYIFETIGMEPWGRFGSGIAELMAGLLILIPKTKTIGAILALGVIAGALFFHLTKLGIDVQGDGGMMFFMAIAVFVLSLIVLVLHRKEIPFLNLK